MIGICLSANPSTHGLTFNAEYRQSRMRPIWKFLEVDDHQAISDQVYQYVLNHTSILDTKLTTFYNEIDDLQILNYAPSLRKFLSDNLLVPKFIAIVIVLPSDNPDNLHVDQLTPYVRVLWPVKNCSGSVTKFYDIPRDLLKEETDRWASTSGYYRPVVKKDWPLLDQFELTQPLVFDVSVAHEVCAAPDATEPRISFTLGFDQDLPISKSVKAWFGFQR